MGGGNVLASDFYDELLTRLKKLTTLRNISSAQAIKKLLIKLLVIANPD